MYRNETDIIYCYPGTDVLINKFGIKEKTKLTVVEIDLTGLRILELKQNPILGKFDMKHLKNIHRYIFQDLYDWAGELRTVEISKGIQFARSDFIISEGTRIFNVLESENYLHKLGLDPFCERLAYYKTEINMLHPFREGNGRAIREFVRNLAQYNGYELDFSCIDKNDYMEAMIKSPYDTQLLKEVFKENITQLEMERPNAKIKTSRKRDMDHGLDR